MNVRTHACLENKLGAVAVAKARQLRSSDPNRTSGPNVADWQLGSPYARPNVLACFGTNEHVCRKSGSVALVLARVVVIYPFNFTSRLHVH